MKQNDAVFSAICSALGQDSFNGAVELNKAQMDEVAEEVTDGIESGNVDFSESAKAKYDERSKVKKYVISMVKNHLRKDKRLNGGTKYEAKNPGSRAGRGDALLANLKTLYGVTSDSEAKKQIQAEIDARKAELQAAKPKKAAEVNWDLLPDSLKHLAG
jgi:hypothetical protein